MYYMKKALIPVEYRCEFCNTKFNPIKMGRPRMYCCGSCKTLAYRKRKGISLLPPWKREYESEQQYSMFTNTMIGGIKVKPCPIMSCCNYEKSVPMSGNLPNGCLGVCREISD
jgi:hypothetical protein